ncbi:MAG: diguanylate cyclase, partial [Nitrospinota bacterium]
TNQVAGVIIINSLLPHKKELVSFDREMFDLMAQHTATAIIAAQLYSKSEQRLTTLYDITRLLSTNINLTDSLKTIIKLIHMSLGPDFTMCGVYIFEKGSKEKNIIASLGCSKEQLDAIIATDKFENIETQLFDIMEGKRHLGKLFAGKMNNVPFPKKEQEMLLSVSHMIMEMMSFETHLEYSKKLAVSLDKEKRQSKAIVNGVSDGLLVVDKNLNTLLINPIVENLFEVNEEEILFKSMFSFVNNSQLNETIQKTFAHGPRSQEISFKKESAEVIYNVVSATIKDEKGYDFGVVSVFHDITREKELENVRNEYIEKLKKISITDSLTGVFNRGYMESRVSAEFKRSQRLDRDFCCMILDIDKFKNINDTYGHDIGDDMIVYMANVLTEQVRESDVVTRFGGDEFVVILPDTSPTSAMIVGERIRQAACSQEFSHNDEKYVITVSIGIAGYNKKDETPDTLLKRADLGLYAAKEAGRNSVRIYEGKEDQDPK